MDELSLNIPNGLIAALRGARHVTALTGAGISAESGVPTFRDAQTGLWVKYRSEDLATPEAFQLNPQLVWEWYAWRRELIARAAPNAGHQALVDMETRLRKFTLITQNVDGLHQQAGSIAVIELHGNITRTKCFQEGIVVESWAETDQPPPRCPHCGGPLRPDVVWFGESVPPDALWAAIETARACDVFFAIGTSALVQPAALLPLEALQHGATVVEVNPDVTPLSAHVTYPVHGLAGHILPALVRATWPNP
jgi:NAD-dependent protein deacetylase/lipoamidase